MKKLLMITSIILTLMHSNLSAQTFTTAVRIKTIKPYPICVTENKTTNLIFPFAIKSVDRGSAGLLVQKAKGVENILQVKAAEKIFKQTNLSVVTVDGGFYSFSVDYANEPAQLNLSFLPDNTAEQVPALLEGTNTNEGKLNRLAQNVRNAKSFLHKKISVEKIRLTLKSIYVGDGALWFHLQLDNSSIIDYSPQYVRFFIREKKKAKRTAIQEIELTPVFRQWDSAVSGKTKGMFILAFPSFTLSKEKELVIQIGEVAGGRSLALPVKNRTILKARKLPSHN